MFAVAVFRRIPGRVLSLQLCVENVGGDKVTRSSLVIEAIPNLREIFPFHIGIVRFVVFSLHWPRDNA